MNVLLRMLGSASAHLLPSDGSPPLSCRPTSFLGRAFLQCVQRTRYLAPKPLVEALVVCICHAHCMETVWQVADSTAASGETSLSDLTILLKKTMNRRTPTLRQRWSTEHPTKGVSLSLENLMSNLPAATLIERSK